MTVIPSSQTISRTRWKAPFFSSFGRTTIHDMRVNGGSGAIWISRLRALSFSAAMSTQWKMGPASEASLGNVQLHEGPGFADFVNTPTIGICEMIGEDITDRYVITGLENRTSNRVVLVLARSFLNPSRTFANLMEFKEPWYRRTRVGLFRENHILRKKIGRIMETVA